MVVVINDDRVTDVEAYLPVAKAFAADSVENEDGCISMEVLTDPEIEGRVLYLSRFESKEAFLKSTQGAIFKKWLPECLSAVDFYCLMSKLRCPFPAIAVDILCKISAAGIHLTETA